LVALCLVIWSPRKHKRILLIGSRCFSFALKPLYLQVYIDS